MMRNVLHIFSLVIIMGIISILNISMNAQNTPVIPDIRLYWSPDGAQVAVAFQAELHLYDAQLSDAVLLPIGLLSDQVDIINVTWDPTGTNLAVKIDTMFDQYIQIWGTQPLQLISQLRDNEIRQGPQWSPDGQHFAVVYGPSSVHIYDKNTAELTTEFTPLSFATIQNFVWNPDRDEIVVGIGTTLYFWDVVSNTLRTQISNAFEPGVNIAFNASGNRLATVSVNDNANLVIWNIDKLEPIQTLAGHAESIYRFAWADADRLATVSFDHTIRVWDISTGQTTRIISVGLVHQIEWYPDDENLYVVDYDDNKTVVNVLTGNTVEFELPSLISCNATIPSADTTALISAITAANSADTPQTICSAEGE